MITSKDLKPGVVVKRTCGEYGPYALHLQKLQCQVELDCWVGELISIETDGTVQYAPERRMYWLDADAPDNLLQQYEVTPNHEWDFWYSQITK